MMRCRLVHLRLSFVLHCLTVPVTAFPTAGWPTRTVAPVVAAS